MRFFGGTPQLLTDGAIYAKVREIIVKAKEKLIIVSPYIEPSSDFVRQLEDAADSRGVGVKVVFREDKVGEYQEKEWFQRLVEAGVTLASVERLHSKIYSSESETIITSMNFYASSGENSFEVGVLFDDAHKLTEQTAAYLNSLERHMKEVRKEGARMKKRAGGADRGSPARVRASVPAGHCIRCAGSIALNPQRPYCADDYETWCRYENEDFEDKYCHRCGKQHPATMRKPLCRDCFEQMR